MSRRTLIEKTVRISIDALELEGVLTLPPDAQALILFSQGGEGAQTTLSLLTSFFHDAHYGTLLFDLLTPQERESDPIARELRFNIPLLSHRLVMATQWVEENESIEALPFIFFGLHTGAAAALSAAAELKERITAVVSVEGRPDLVGKSLHKVETPTLLIIGEEDHGRVDSNAQTLALLPCEKKIEIIPKGHHLLEEEAMLEEVAKRTLAWLQAHS